MAGPQHARMNRTGLENLVVSYASADYPFMSREHAVRAVLHFNDLQAAGMDDTAFNSAVVALASKLVVTMPTVAADLSTLTDAQLVALANSLELAFWDYHRRTYALDATYQFWAKKDFAPTAAEYLTTFLTIANYTRAARGLAAIT